MRDRILSTYVKAASRVHPYSDRAWASSDKCGIGISEELLSHATKCSNRLECSRFSESMS